MWLRRWTLAVGATLALAGCGQTLDLRDPLPDGGPYARHRLEVLTEQPLRLTTLESAAFEVRYTDPDGAPVEGATIELFLAVGQGSPGTDATLLEGAAVTDADGVATGTVMAGSMTASFRVRASAPDAASVYVDVSVSDAGFGDLEVTASYVGARTPDALAVLAFGQASCEEAWARVAAPDREQSVAESGDSTTFEALPAGVAYAVAALVRSSSGAVVAWGCEESAAVLADALSSAAVVATDLPLDPKGLYSGEALLAAPTAPATVEAALTDAAGELVTALGGDAAALLTSLTAALSAEGEASCAANLEANLSVAIPVVQGELDGASVGVDEALAAGAVDAALRAARLKLAGALTIDEATPGALTATYELTGLSVGADDGSPLVAVDVAELALGGSVVVEGSWSAARDVWTVSLLEVPLPLTSVAAALMTVAAATAGDPSTGAWLGGMGVCDAVAASPTLAGYGCSAGGLLAVCEARMDALAELALASAAPTLDAERATLALAGTLTFTDDDDDRVPESLSGSVTGAWTGPDALVTDAVTGTFAGARVAGIAPAP